MRRIAFAAVLSALLPCSAIAQAPSAAEVQWLGTWASAQQIPEPANALPPADMRDVTFREIVRASVGGTVLRIRLSNAFGAEPLHFTSVHIARPLANSGPATPPPAPAPGATREIPPPVGPRIDPSTDCVVTFSGRTDVIVPAGSDYLSDPIRFPLVPLGSIAVSFHLDAPPAVETGHPGSRQTTWYAHGDLTASADMPTARAIDHWYQLSGIDVATDSSAGPDSGSIVILGDSITDGHGSTTNGNDRWTDVLAERLQSSATTTNIGVLNEGIGGNHLLTNGLGPSALSRFDRDVLAQTAVRWLIVLEGVNDLGGLTKEGPASPAAHAALVAQVIAGYQQIIERAHAHGLKVIGSTITPYQGSDFYHPDAADEADRQTVNQWIRTAGHFDAVLDFDQVVRDPRHPDRLLPAYDCGDHLHPGPAGHRAMGAAVPLGLFSE